MCHFRQTYWTKQWIVLCTDVSSARVAVLCAALCAYHVFVTICCTLGGTCFVSRHFVNKVSAGRGRHWNFDPQQCLGPRPKILDRYISWAAYGDCRQRATSDSRIFIGLSGSRDWSHGESHSPDGPMPAAILENFHCEQPCYGFLGLLKFLCFQTLPNLVNCLLIIFSLVWHPKDFAQIKIIRGKNASNPSNRSAIVKSFSLCLTFHH